jgi:hypothetical protein
VFGLLIRRRSRSNILFSFALRNSKNLLATNLVSHRRTSVDLILIGRRFTFHIILLQHEDRPQNRRFDRLSMKLCACLLEPDLCERRMQTHECFLRLHSCSAYCQRRSPALLFDTIETNGGRQFPRMNRTFQLFLSYKSTRK